MRAVTSASNIHRRALCPGSERMEAGLPEEDSEASAEGRLLHSYDANPQLDRAFLKSIQVDLLELSAKLDEAIFKRVREQFVVPEGEPFEEGREKLLMALGDTNAETPGHCDRWRYWPGKKLLCIIDKKFGYKVVTPAAANYQLRSYAIGGWDEWDIDNCVVGITQPRLAYEERITMAAYNSDEIDAAIGELTFIRRDCRQPDAPLVAGEEQCRYCKARATCPAFQAVIQAGLALVPAVDPEASVAKRQDDIARCLADCSDESLGKLLNALQFAGFISELTRDEARARIGAEPDRSAAIGWKLGKESEKRNIVNVTRAIALLTLQGDLTREEILTCSKPSLTKLQDKIRDKNKITHKRAKEIVNETLEGTIEMEEKRPPLTRI